MNGALQPLARSINEPKELTTGNKITVSAKTRQIVFSKDIDSQKQVYPSEKRNLNDKLGRRTHTTKPYNIYPGVGNLTHIGILLCVIILAVSSHTAAIKRAVNCR